MMLNDDKKLNNQHRNNGYVFLYELDKRELQVTEPTEPEVNPDSKRS